MELRSLHWPAQAEYGNGKAVLQVPVSHCSISNIQTRKIKKNRAVPLKIAKPNAGALC
jgi:hypothetical protein